MIRHNIISVIIPCYNVSKYLRDSLDGLLSSAPPALHFEIICIDDCSTDNTNCILKEYKDRYPDTIVLVEHKVNCGCGTAWRDGLERASGEYVAFVDADDRIDPNMFTKLYHALNEHGCDIAECGYYEFDKNGVGRVSCPDNRLYNMTNVNDKREYLLKDDIYTLWRRLYRREFLESSAIAMSSERIYADVGFVLTAAMCAGSICTISEPLYGYLQRAQSMIHSPAARECVMENYDVMEHWYDFLVKCGAVPGESDNEIAFVYYRQVFNHIINMEVESMQEDGGDLRLDRITVITKAMWKHFGDITKNRYIIESSQDEFHTGMLTLAKLLAESQP